MPQVILKEVKEYMVYYSEQEQGSGHSLPQFQFYFYPFPLIPYLAGYPSGLRLHVISVEKPFLTTFSGESLPLILYLMTSHFVNIFSVFTFFPMSFSPTVTECP